LGVEVVVLLPEPVAPLRCLLAVLPHQQLYRITTIIGKCRL
jgi:hypothetical protein